MGKQVDVGPLEVADESQFSLLVDEISSRIQACEAFSVEEYAKQFPQHAEQLRQLVPTLRAMADLGHSVAEPPEGGSSAEGAAEPAGGLLGDFRIIRELGRGGMGVVYEAEQLSLQRPVALKVLPFAAVLDQRQLTRFKNEALAAAQLDHPHIVDVFGVGCERGVHHYAMRYIQGETLAGIIQQLRHAEQMAKTETAADAPPATAEFAPTVISGSSPAAATDQTLPFGETAPLAALSTEGSATSREFYRAVAALTRDVARALDYAHERGVIHRDIKPANIMLDGVGKAWVTDFGLARIESDVSLTMSGDLLGTLRYMSPEQALAKRVGIDHRTDIYSLGVTLYELLTLQPAYPETDRQLLLHRIAFEDPTPPRQLRPQISQDLETIVLKATAKNPQERYETAGELADDLQRFLDHQPIKARRPTLRQRVAKWAHRHTALVWSAAAILMVSTIALAVSTLLIAREQSATASALTQSQKNLDEAKRQEEEAKRQRLRAEENFQRAREAVDTYLTKVSEDTLLNQPGTQPLRKDLLELALRYYEEFAEERADDPTVQEELADAYSRVGGIQGAIGSPTDAFQAYGKSIVLWQQLVEQTPQDLSRQLSLAKAYRNQARQIKRFEVQQRNSARRQILNEGTVDPLQRALKNLERLHAQHPTSDEVLLERIHILREVRRLDAARRALELAYSLGEDHPSYLTEVAQCEYHVGVLLGSQTKVPIGIDVPDPNRAEAFVRESISHSQNALNMMRELLRREPTMKTQCDLAMTCNALGAGWDMLARLLVQQESAEADISAAQHESDSFEKEAIETLENLVAQNPTVVDYASSLALLHSNRMLTKAEEFNLAPDAAVHEALMWHTLRAIQIYHDIRDRFPNIAINHKSLANAIQGYQNGVRIIALNDLFDAQEQQRLLEQGRNVWLEIPARDRTAEDWGQLGQLCYYLEEYDQARSAIEQSIELRAESGPTTADGPRWWYLTMLLERGGESDRARQLYEHLSLEAVLLHDELEATYRSEVADVLGVDFDSEAKPSDPEGLLNRAIAADVRRWEAYFKLGTRLLQTNRPVAAARAYAVVVEQLSEIPEEQRTIGDLGKLAQALFRSKQYAESLRTFETVLELRGDTAPTIKNGPRWWYMAMLLAHTGETDRAHEIYRQLATEMESHPNRPAHERYRAELAQLLGIDDPRQNAVDTTDGKQEQSGSYEVPATPNSKPEGD